MHINHSTNKQGRTYRYFYDYGRKTMTGCPHDYATELKPDQVEDIAYTAVIDITSRRRPISTKTALKCKKLPGTAHMNSSGEYYFGI